MRSTNDDGTLLVWRGRGRASTVSDSRPETYGNARCIPFVHVVFTVDAGTRSLSRAIAVEPVRLQHLPRELKMPLGANRWGKSEVRVSKVLPGDEFVDITVQVLLEGDVGPAHTEGDNVNVLPTDTMRNTDLRDGPRAI